ncbi:protein Dok-7-like isoform X1 [Simochromis diagramma]|uniref:protein Dok-7-like isoform X1 n=1 Tax=Simochromis diagramma TaxID=43689 RepID=UPI001A7E35DA|nr:protein Dok-7-like isoform X1 [Simochromis diagramma]
MPLGQIQESPLRFTSFQTSSQWKTRWVVLRKPSPVADCLSLLVYKEKKKGKEKGSGHKERLNVTLEGICGLEPGLGYDGVSYTLSILCLAHMLVLGFNNRDTLLAWDARIRYSLGEVHRFSVNVEPGTKLESGPASLHLCNNLLVLTRGLPPVVVGHWKLSALRRYGAVPNGFVFEGGTRCGYWAGVFFLSCSEGEQISFLFDCIVRGINPSRAPHGLQPDLPADPSADPASAEERINLEASVLEKRLSMLSQCSLASSTASSYSCSTSVAGDDHSSISSSSSSQSDASYGSRLPVWAEPLGRLHLSSETASSSSTLKALASSDDRLYSAVLGGSRSHPSSTHIHPRGLHDSGRQSSLDSGIGIATGSHSSYSGSYSSCTGSLDMASGGVGEEFGSVASLPPAPSFPSSPPSAPPPTPPSSPFQPMLIPEGNTASFSCSSRSASRTSRRHSEEYRIPSLLRLWYDTPRSLLRAQPQKKPSSHGAQSELSKDNKSSGDGGDGQGQGGVMAQRQAMMQRSHSWGSERAPSVDSEGRATPRPLLVPGGLFNAEKQCSHGLDNYITQEQWRSVRNTSYTQTDSSPLMHLTPSADSQDSPLCIREERHDSSDISSKLASLKKLLPSLLLHAPPPPPVPPSMHRPTSACGMFRFSHEAPPPASQDCGPCSNSSTNYVNIPVSPLLYKTRELLYTELELQKPSSAPASSPHSAERGNSVQLCRLKEGSIRYAHLDITAMETAQRVGAEHVQAREDRLTQLESRRQGPPN